MQTGFVWLRTATSGVLWQRQYIFCCCKMQGISLLTSGMSTSEEGLCFANLFTDLGRQKGGTGN